MYPVSPSIENWLRKRAREFLVMATVNDVEYHDDVLLDFSIENSLSLSDELELGTVIPNKLTIRFRTQQEFAPNAKIVPFIALSADNLTWAEADIAWGDAVFPWEGGHTEWMPMGEFYIDNRTEDRGVWTYTCYDKLVFADVPYISQLTYPASMQAVWDEICTRLGFAYDSSVQIDPSYMIGAGPAGYSCRQVMGFIASANSACAYMGKDSMLKFKTLSAAEMPAFEMTEADYVRAKLTNPLKTYSRVVLIYDIDDGLFYEAGTGDDSQTLFIENPFGTQGMADAILAEIDGFSYTPVSMPARGYPQLDQGDIFEFERFESHSWVDADLAWDDADFPWDGRTKHHSIILHQVLDFKGGLSMQIEAPTISEQQSEFIVEGTLEQAVNKLNRDTIKYDKPYHGVTHSKEHGIVTQFGSNKLTINSDVLLDWEVNGVRKLYYDENDDAIKFSGVIEASELTGNTISGGVITGASIQGGTINGGVITGALIQTKPTGQFPRIELSSTSNLLRAESSPGYRIDLDPTFEGELVFRSPNRFTTMFQSEISFDIISTSEMWVIPGGDLRLDSVPGTVQVGGWNKLRSVAVSRTLQQELDSINTQLGNLNTRVTALENA